MLQGPREVLLVFSGSFLRCSDQVAFACSDEDVGYVDTGLEPGHSKHLVVVRYLGLVWLNIIIILPDTCTDCESNHFSTHIPANTTRQPIAGLMLAQRRRRWANINPALGRRVVFFEIQVMSFKSTTPLRRQSNITNNPTIYNKVNNIVLLLASDADGQPTL